MADDVERAVVITDIVTSAPGELSLKANDIVTIVSKATPKAWLAQYKGASGRVPPANLKVLDSYWRGKRGKCKREVKPEDANHLGAKQGEVIVLLEQQGNKWLGIYHERQGLVYENDLEILQGHDLAYQHFAELILKDDLLVTTALCAVIPVTAADQLSKALINVFEARGNTVKLLRVLIEDEARNTQSASTLFRSNSMASKLMSAFGRLTGQEYLHTTLRPLVRWIGASATSFEIDPAKMVDGDIIEENRKNLLEGAELFYSGIKRSISSCPQSFRAICHILQSCVIDRFPESKHSVVGGFFFLRFMCPAIISPEGFGVLADGQVLLDEARRALVLVSKLLQNLANGKLFGSKEAYMVPMQEFILSHQEEIKQFFDELADVNLDDVKTEALITVSETDFKNFLKYIHTQCNAHLVRIEERLKKVASETGKDPDTFRPLIELKELLSQLPTATTTSTPSASSSNLAKKK